MKTVTCLGMALAFLCSWAEPLGAQDPLTQAKGLYDSASYTEALSALNEIASTADVIEVEKYRALCLLALNRPQDAEKSLEHLATTRPLFTLDGSDASPKLVALFQDVRKRTLPDAAKQTYQHGRTSFEAGNMAEAARQFKDVISMAEAAPRETAASMEDLKMLSVGFLKLAETALTPTPEVRAAAPPPPAAPAATPGVAPAVTAGAAPSGINATATPPATTSSTTPVRPPSRAATLVAAARARDAAAGGRIYDASDTTIVPPKAISRPVPTWDRPRSLRSFAFQGLLEVIVAEDGTVFDTTMVKLINPVYDQELMTAAKKWRYEPAKLEGRGVKFRLTYSFNIPPAS
jgi:outer membrane biosynthesis protein TonB